MAFFGLKTYFKNFFLGYFCPPIKVMWKNWANRASKWVFIGGALKAPTPYFMLIPEAPYGRVKQNFLLGFFFYLSLNSIGMKEITFVILTPTPSYVKKVENIPKWVIWGCIGATYGTVCFNYGFSSETCHFLWFLDIWTLWEFLDPNCFLQILQETDIPSKCVSIWFFIWLRRSPTFPHKLHM